MHQLGTRLRARAAMGALAAGVMLAAGMIATPASAATDDPRVDTVYGFAEDVYAQPGGHMSFTARYLNEMGDRISLGGEARELDTVTVTLQSFACITGGWNAGNCTTTPGATFTHPITVNLYEVGSGGAVGDLIVSSTQDETIPYRPSADPTSCEDDPDTSFYLESAWFYDETRGKCSPYVVHTMTFDLSNQAVTLPDEVIAAVHFPTVRTDPDSYPGGGPWDSLDISLSSVAPTVGGNVNQGILYFDSTDETLFPAEDEDPVPGVLTPASGWMFDNNYYRTPLISITASPTTPVTSVSSYVNGFENGTGNVGLVTRANGGTLASSGCWYAEAPVTNYGTHASAGKVSTVYGGSATYFPNAGYTTSADFYLDKGAPLGQFAWDSSVNGTDGALQRDFIFVAGSNGSGTWRVDTTGSAATSSPYRSSYSGNAISITESGWYTFRHRFYAEGGRLYAEMTVRDASGATLGTWTRGGNAGDLIPTLVGGSREGWLINNSYADLRMDNVVLGAPRPTGGCDTGQLFSDVPPSASNFDAISWMVTNGYADGFPDGTYRPTNPVNRAQMARFLYRLAGEPAVDTSSGTSFWDVDALASNYTAIIWIEKQALADGFPDGSYRPTSPINRAQMARFLYRLAGEPAVTLPTSSPFSDVAPSASNYAAIVWMSQVGIADGFADGTYRPTTAVNRAQMARFLLRMEEAGV
ncbi:S-layer homology domain-containing protein [Demequina maris]|uniref:S-layer homology domain-containing protein n=1 Tax=Demequina maris TaxID=1638982 RepID=UPI0009E4D3E3|nr:S-layer homology domain-containing protein [Demequina maris]